MADAGRRCYYLVSGVAISTSAPLDDRVLSVITTIRLGPLGIFERIGLAGTFLSIAMLKAATYERIFIQTMAYLGWYYQSVFRWSNDSQH